jgi:hypothetical protein
MFIHCRKPVKRNVLRRHPAAYSFAASTRLKAIVGRLNRIEGQIHGMRFMVQEPGLCVGILQHLGAAEAAQLDQRRRFDVSGGAMRIGWCRARRAGTLAKIFGDRRHLRPFREVI